METHFWNHLNTILTHKKYVFKYCCIAGIPWRGIKHDMSKFSPIEFNESIKYWSGDRSPIDNCKDVNGYSVAWQHHKGRNTHHWEYWIDNIDNGEEGHPTAILMPFEDCLEMICDYLGAGNAYQGDKWSPKSQLDWWNWKKKHCLMHPVVYAFVEGTLTDFCHGNLKNELKYNNMKNRYDCLLDYYNKGELKV
jgi:hypothetical protein